MTPLGAFGVSTEVAGLALEVAALPVLGVSTCAGIGFHWSRVWQISFWCSPIVCQFFGWLGPIQCALALFGVVVRLFHHWLGLSGATLGVFLVHCVLCCVGDSGPCILVGSGG